MDLGPFSTIFQLYFMDEKICLDDSYGKITDKNRKLRTTEGHQNKSVP
jgi:hypothetical protein